MVYHGIPSFILLLFICIHFFAFCLVGHNSFLIEKKAPEAKSFGKSELVLASQGAEAIVISGTETIEDNLGIASFGGPIILSSHHCRDGAPQASAMEVQVLQEIEQSCSNVLRSMWQTLDRSFGWQLSSPYIGTSQGGGLLLPVGRGDTVGTGGLAFRQMAVSIPSCFLSVTNATWWEKASQNQEEQEAEGCAGISGTSVTRSSMESQRRQRLSWWFVIGNDVKSTYTGNQVGPEVEADHGGSEKARSQLDSGPAAIGPGDNHGPITRQYKAVALGCFEVGSSQKGIAEAPSIQAELACSVEELHCRECQQVERLLRTIRKAGQRSCQAFTRGSSVSEDCGGRIGIHQEGGERDQRGRGHVGTSPAGDFGRRESGAVGPQRCQHHGGYERHAQESRSTPTMCGGGYRSQGSQAPKVRRSWGWRWWTVCSSILTTDCWAAFSTARSIDHTEIDLGRDVAGDAYGFALKWSHSATKRRRFVPEWKASIAALDLAHEMGYFDVGHAVPDPVSSLRSSNRNPKAFCVGFAEEVAVAIGEEDSLSYHQVAMKHEHLCGWIDKPWQLRNSVIERQCPLGEPLSEKAVLISRHCSKSSKSGGTWEADHDEVAWVQTGKPFAARGDVDVPGWAVNMVQHHYEPPQEEQQSDSSVGEGSEEGGSPDTVHGSRSEIENQLDESLQSVLLFHLADPTVHGYVHWTHIEDVITEVSSIMGVNRNRVFNIHELKWIPPDIPEHFAPLIVQFNDDLPVGQPSHLCLVDVEVHANTAEFNYATVDSLQLIEGC